MMKAFIISQPKSGTYLAANLLECLGFDFSHIHVDPGMYRIFKNNDVNNFKKFNKDIDEALSNINDNQFAVGHIPSNVKNKEALKNFKKILVTRDPEKILDSAKRYQKEKGIEVYSIINEENLKAIKKWSKNKDVFSIDFLDLMNEDVDKINSLQVYLFGEVRHDSLSAIRQAKEKESLTKSSIR